MEIIENALPDHIREAALAFFPRQDWEHWHHYGSGKLATKDALRIPRACQIALEHLACKIAPPRGFPDYDYHAAGLHFMPAGSELGKHIDAESHPTRPWKRVASLVYFLESCKGGELVVGDLQVQPVAGTAAIFNSNQIHHVNRTETDRRTLALFYWELSDEPKGTTQADFLEIESG